jgi:Family of unknown function (DUF6884)
VNQQSLYVRSDGAQLPGYQVSSIAHGTPSRFRVERGLIGLAGWEPADAPSAETENQGDQELGSPVAVLIGCVAHKEPGPRPAKDLYRGSLFTGRRRYAEARGLPWFIVSARYGLLAPDMVVEPYDVRLADLGADERHALAEQIARELEASLGPVAGQAVEVHAGDEYYRMLGIGLRPRGATLQNPLRGLRIGEQLAWYRERGGASAGHSPPATPAPTVEPGSPGLARTLTEAFVAGRLDLSTRDGAPTPGWAGMPELIVAERMRAAGARDVDVRLLLTFAAAMDRARDADRLWFAAERLYEAAPWAFDPAQVVDRNLIELADALREYKVSQRHRADSAAWRTIAEALVGAPTAVHIRRLR